MLAILTVVMLTGATMTTVRTLSAWLAGQVLIYPKSYRPISLLCVPYKILERFIYARVEPLIDPLLPKEQAGFRRRKSTVDQVVLLTQNIEDSFEAKKKAGAVFINLTATYDTVLTPWPYLQAAETTSG